MTDYFDNFLVVNNYICYLSFDDIKVIDIKSNETWNLEMLYFRTWESISNDLIVVGVGASIRLLKLTQEGIQDSKNSLNLGYVNCIKKTLRGPSIEVCLGTNTGLIFGVINSK